MFETHPLTIANAPTPLHYISDQDSEKKGKENTRGGGDILLAARVVGDWTKTINDYCFEERERLFGSANSPSNSSPSEPTFNEIPIPIQVMIDGPYGGLSIDLGEYENVLLVAGGSGASFTVGVLDEIVGRCCDGARKGGEKTRRIEFVWYMKSFGGFSMSCCVHWDRRC